MAAPGVGAEGNEQASQEPSSGSQHDPIQESAHDVGMLPRVAVAQPLSVPLESCEGINVAAVVKAYNDQSDAPAVDANL
eukprot:1334946-Karenia_brevis.AAC.1